MKTTFALAALLSVSTATLGATTLFGAVPSIQLGTSGTITGSTAAGMLGTVPLPIPDPGSPFPPASALMPLPIPDPGSPFPPASALMPLPIPDPGSPFPPATR
jgi:hypothetical protein